MNLATWAEGRPVLAAYERFHDRSRSSTPTPTRTRRRWPPTSDDADPRPDRHPGRPRGSSSTASPGRAGRGCGRTAASSCRQPRQGGRRASWPAAATTGSAGSSSSPNRRRGRHPDDRAGDRRTSAPTCSGVVEAENRPALVRFNDALLDGRYAARHARRGQRPARHRRRRCMTGDGYPIASIRSHVDDPDPERPAARLFSRDCPVYEVRTPSGATLWVLVNHLKSQSWTSGDPDPLRRRQAPAVRGDLRGAAGRPAPSTSPSSATSTRRRRREFTPASSRCSARTAAGGRVTLPGFESARGRARSSPAASATGSTTSCCHRRSRSA